MTAQIREEEAVSEVSTGYGYTCWQKGTPCCQTLPCRGIPRPPSRCTPSRPGSTSQTRPSRRRGARAAGMGTEARQFRGCVWGANEGKIKCT